MTTVEAYKTSDGKIFAEHGEAAHHQRELDFKKHYENEYILSQDGGHVTADSVMEWLRENKKAVTSFYNTYL